MLVFDFAENNFEEFKKGGLFLQAIVDVDMIVACPENEKEIVIRSATQFDTFRTVN